MELFYSGKGECELSLIWLNLKRKKWCNETIFTNNLTHINHVIYLSTLETTVATKTERNNLKKNKKRNKSWWKNVLKIEPAFLIKMESLFSLSFLPLLNLVW